MYDVDLTMTLPIGLSATSGVDAIAYTLEALYTCNGNPIANLLAQEGIKALADTLPELIKDPSS